MNCPDKETFQDFVDGELSESKVKQIVKHIRLCDTCKTELRELYTLHNALNQVVGYDKCPSLDALEKYADNSYSDEQTSKIAEHIDFCSRCRSYVWAFHASEEELANWQTQEELAYNEFVHTTYKNYIRLAKPDDNCEELFLHEDMLYYNGVYYGDWSVFTEEIFKKGKFATIPFEQSKANLPVLEQKH